MVLSFNLSDWGSNVICLDTTIVCNYEEIEILCTFVIIRKFWCKNKSVVRKLISNL